MSFIKFLGTAGARFVMIRQLRSSGGIWLQHKATNILIDPGPGSLIRCNTSRPKLDPLSLDAIILTHKHLDHSSDVNVMIEAMTEGGFKKRGYLFAPQDAFGNGGVIFQYLENYVQDAVVLKEGTFTVKDVAFTVPIRNDHSVQTYGLKFSIDDCIVSIVSDTKYFTDLSDIYRNSDILILNVVFHHRREPFQHFCLEDAQELIEKVKPTKAIITHFGMTMLQAKPHALQEKLRKETNRDIVFAYDGMRIELPLKE